MEFLKLTFINGMNMAAANSKYCANVESYLDGLDLELDDENVGYIYEHFNNLNLQTKEKEYIEVSKEFFEMIPDKMERLAEVFAENHLDVPIMKYYNMNTLFERILLLNNEDVVLLKDLIAARYEKVTDLENEERNIRLLKQTMEEYIRGKIPTIKVVLLEDFIKTLDTNLVSLFLVSRTFGNLMLENKKGKIINIASTNGIDSYYEYSLDYDTSKAGVINLTHNLANHYSPYINVNCVCPGWIDTPMNKDLDESFKQKEIDKILLRRFASPKEIASLVYFLSTDEASYINDSIIKIDGGRKC